MNPQELQVSVHYANFLKPDCREWPGRRLGDYELILAIDGNYELLLESGEIVVQQPGEAIFIYPDERHTFRASPGAKRLFFACVHFDLPGGRGFVEQLPRRIGVGRSMGILTELFRRLPVELHTSGRFRQEISNHICEEILLRLWEVSLSPPSGGENTLRELTEFIDAHLAAHPGREALAKEFFLSKPYINRLFQTHLGETPTEYLHRRLACRGYELLFYGNRSVKETAAELGFANPFHFSRVFKKVFGLSPSRLQASRRFFR